MIAQHLPGPGLPGQALGLHDFPTLGITHKGRHHQGKARVEEGWVAQEFLLAIGPRHRHREKRMKATVDPVALGRIMTGIHKDSPSMHQGQAAHAVGIHRLHARAFQGRTPTTLGMAHHLDHLAARPL